MDTIDSAREAWSRYTATGALPRELLRDFVYRAWQRSHEGGADPCRPAGVRASADEFRRLLQQQHPLIEVAEPFLNALSSAAGDQPHVALISDDHAVVLATVGTEADVRVFAPGTLCSEECSGATGLSTTLAEGRYVEIIGPEHFIQGFHKYTCQAAPIHGPEGDIVAVASTALRQHEASTRLRSLFLCATHGIEAELMQRRLAADAQQVRDAAEPRSQDLEKLRQDVVQLHTLARLNISLAARVSGERPQAAARLVRAADQAIQQFHRFAAFWRLLAGIPPEPTEPLDLPAQLWLLGELLETELATRDVHLVLELPDAGPAVHAHVLRQLFHHLMATVELAGRGGAIRVRVWRSVHPAWPQSPACIAFETTPGPDHPDPSRRRWVLNIEQLDQAATTPPAH